MAARKIETADVVKVAVGIGTLATLWAVARFFRGAPDPDPMLPPDLEVPVITMPPTFTRGQAQAVADVIFAAIYGSGGFWSGQTTEDEDLIIGAMMTAANDADVALIIDQYGRRSGSWSTSGDLTLPQALATFLSAEDRGVINADYAARGLTWRF